MNIASFFEKKAPQESTRGRRKKVTFGTSLRVIHTITATRVMRIEKSTYSFNKAMRELFPYISKHADHGVSYLRSIRGDAKVLQAWLDKNKLSIVQDEN